ncbi:hypothetical protein [Euzebya tangerina]|uniref:HD domain-containing protein n=1 Tax=Euzebya tangerina TaxID=591198 RepID=UPI000E31799F|nr:hypothetical protein [Euzebya tangerina]
MPPEEPRPDPPDPAGILPAGVRSRLVTAYRRPPREYHTLEHAGDVAKHVAGLGGNRACLLAAWFHDVVYEPTASDNEEQSARLVEAWLDDDPDVAEAARLVRLTAAHRPANDDDRQGAILCDADLAILGSTPPVYEVYRSAVRREYRHVEEDDWRTGRSAVLRELLGRDPLFLTDEARERWEQRARANLAAELATLTGES